jgi:hypothetical protein
MSMSRQLRKETLDLLTCAGISWLKGNGTVWVSGLCFSDPILETQVQMVLNTAQEDLPRLLAQRPDPEDDIEFYALREPIYRWRLQHECETDL